MATDEDQEKLNHYVDRIIDIIFNTWLECFNLLSYLIIQINIFQLISIMEALNAVVVDKNVPIDSSSLSLRQTLSDPSTKCIICLETWAALEPQVIKLMACTHLLW
jgi:hypothetical protein